MKHDELDQPATKRDLHELDQRLTAKIAAIKDEILHHFDAVTENIQHDVAGANADEISLIKNKQDDHEQRIATLERA